MKKILATLLAMLFLMGSSAGLVAAQDSTPAAGDDATAAASDDVNPSNPQIGDTVTYFAENGNAVGTISVTDIERNWEGYDEYQEPDLGVEYVAVTFSVESTTTRGAIDITPYDFYVVDGQGFVHSRAYATNEDSGDDLQVLADETNLAGGETLEFLLIFEVYEDQPLNTIIWQPDSSIFLILANISEV